jgi:hypothetical protein
MVFMIKGRSAKLSPAIVVLTSIVLFVLFGSLFAACLVHQWPLVIRFLPVVGLGIITLGCYLRSPVAYEITPDNKLITSFRLGSCVFSSVKHFSKITEPVNFGLRLWGNGGLFAVTGVHWSRGHGRFRVYVTNLEKLVLVELENGKKIVISPDNAEEWTQ